MKILLVAFLSLCFLNLAAQSKNSFYALDSNMNQTVMDSSKYILWIHEKEDSNWQWDYYYTWGPLIKSESYADHDGTILNGKTFLYNKAGNIDSISMYDHGKKNGSFWKFRSYTRDSLAAIMIYDYDGDSLTKITDLRAHKSDSLKKDSSNEKESEYPGGSAAWLSYMQHNLEYPQRAMNREIQGSVRIQFVVSKEGNVEEAYIEKSVEYSLDQEALKLIRKSGKWLPSTRDGIPVKAYQVQPVNFKLEVN